MRRYAWILVALAVLALWAWQQRTPPVVVPAPSSTQATTPGTPSRPLPPVADGSARNTGADTARWPAWLPPEAIDTLDRIERGGPFAHRQDGATFQNRERLLPPRPRGYYHEYTVETPGSRDRGARRIVAGGEPPLEYFYSDDHYRSFRRFVPSGGMR
jgi:guanyl-specific ribonuclease Sa